MVWDRYRWIPMCIYVDLCIWYVYIWMYLCIYVSVYLWIYAPMYLCILVRYGSMYLCILCTYVSYVPMPSLLWGGVISQAPPSMGNKSSCLRSEWNHYYNPSSYNRIPWIPSVVIIGLAQWKRGSFLPVIAHSRIPEIAIIPCQRRIHVIDCWANRQLAPTRLIKICDGNPFPRHEKNAGLQIRGSNFQSLSSNSK